MYAREIEGRILTFGVSGKLLMNNVVMYDHQTDSLWSQFFALAVRGPMKDTELEPIPALQTTLEAWLELHPDTLVMDPGGAYNLYDGYISYYLGPDAGIYEETVKDDRLPTKEFIVGVQVEGQPRAYPFRLLAQTPVINDSLGGQPILMVYDSESATAVVYRREVDGRTLTFSPLEQEENGVARFKDQETGTTWLALSGEALEGELKGSTLTRLPSHYSFWFAWKDHFPQTEVYGQ